jgi:hypothetical protein
VNAVKALEVVKVVKAFSPTFGFGEFTPSLRETWRKSLHNLQMKTITFR